MVWSIDHNINIVLSKEGKYEHIQNYIICLLTIDSGNGKDAEKDSLYVYIQNIAYLLNLCRNCVDKNSRYCPMCFTANSNKLVS